MRKAMRSGMAVSCSNNPAAARGDGRTLGGDLLAIARRAIGRHRIDGAAGIQPRHGEDRLDISAIGRLQRLRRHQRVISFLEAFQRYYHRSLVAVAYRKQQAQEKKDAV